MRMLGWLMVAIVMSAVGVACATGPSGGSVTIITEIDFSAPPFHGTFELTEGADSLGCPNGTFVDSPTADAIHKEFKCETGSKTGTFTAEFRPPEGPWSIVDATEDFEGLSGGGDFSVIGDASTATGVETLTGEIQFNP